MEEFNIQGNDLLGNIYKVYIQADVEIWGLVWDILVYPLCGAIWSDICCDLW